MSTFGKAIDAEPREGEQADDDQREDEHPGEDRALDAELGEPLHDVSSRTFTSAPSLSRSRPRGDDAIAGRQAAR